MFCRLLIWADRLILSGYLRQYSTFQFTQVELRSPAAGLTQRGDSTSSSVFASFQPTQHWKEAWFFCSPERQSLKKAVRHLTAAVGNLLRSNVWGLAIQCTFCVLQFLCINFSPSSGTRTQRRTRFHLNCTKKDCVLMITQNRDNKGTQLSRKIPKCSK